MATPPEEKQHPKAHAAGNLSRRRFLQAGSVLALGGAGFGGLAMADGYSLNVTRYHVTPEQWPKGLSIRLALIADIHACDPWMTAAGIERIAARTNTLRPDAVLLLGDYRAGRFLSRYSRALPDQDWARGLSQFEAPLGTHAVLGNHDWWDEPELQDKRGGVTKARRALEAAGTPVYENDVVRLGKDGHNFWLAGLADQWAFYKPREIVTTSRQFKHEGLDDLPGTLAKISSDDPVILMAHEPDIFVDVPKRVALTVCGHTHGGQVNVLGYSPAIPSAYGARYRYGHIVEENRHLIVSGGLGYSAAPIRVGVPPEIVIVDVGGSPQQTVA